MHHVRMTSNDCAKLDGELEISSAQVVEGKVEKTDTSIPVQRINDISSSLLTDGTPSKIQVSDILPMKDNKIA